MQTELLIISCSTRPGRKGIHIARWVFEEGMKHPEFETELIDLGELNLPMMDEPNHPRLRQYTQEHTKQWSARIDAADAFIFVAPEYNYSLNAPFKNAIDYLQQEWAGKPAAIVSYGGVSGGTRAAQMMKQTFSGVNLFPVADAPIPFFTQFIAEDGTVAPNEAMQRGTDNMFKALEKWAGVLKGGR